jgi:hypothetical protein
VVVSILLFVLAAGGGFALSRYVGGEPLLPPKQTTPSSTTQPPADDAEALKVTTDNAAPATGPPGGGFSLPVPTTWVKFAEEVTGDELPSSSSVYYVSPDGTQLLTVERYPAFYPKHSIDDYIGQLKARGPDVVIEDVEVRDIPGLGNPGAGPVRESAKEIKYRPTADAKELVPDDPGVLSQNRVTFAHLLPYASALWVVSVTVPIEQEDSGSLLFEEIARQFGVTG